ncbi:MAG: transcriptional regulator [Desulfobulbaceae bacterium]|nr:transcriptional regulator [Desulfobulbaceae bacterium]
MKTAVVRARIPEELKKDFEAAAAVHDMSLSHVIRTLMAQYVANEKEMARRRQETLEALEDIETGRVVNGDEVMSWLASWGADDEVEPPQ